MPMVNGANVHTYTKYLAQCFSIISDENMDGNVQIAIFFGQSIVGNYPPLQEKWYFGYHTEYFKKMSASSSQVVFVTTHQIDDG